MINRYLSLCSLILNQDQFQQNLLVLMLRLLQKFSNYHKIPNANTQKLNVNTLKEYTKI